MSDGPWDSMWEQRRLEDSLSSDEPRKGRLKHKPSRPGVGTEADDPTRKARPRAVMVDGRTIGIETGWGKNKQFHKVTPEQSDAMARNWTDLKKGNKSVWDVIGGNPFAPPAPAKPEAAQEAAAVPAVEETNPASGPDEETPPTTPSHPASPLDIRLGPPGHEEVLREEPESGMGGGDDPSGAPGDRPLRGTAHGDILWWKVTEGKGKWELHPAPTGAGESFVLGWNATTSAPVWLALQDFTCP